MTAHWWAGIGLAAGAPATNMASPRSRFEARLAWKLIATGSPHGANRERGSLDSAGALQRESPMGAAKKTKNDAKAVKRQAKKDAGKVKHKGKKAKNAAKH